MLPAEPDVTVVIPTRDRPHRLVRCLAALEDQTLERGRFEVIVVDDGSTVPVAVPEGVRVVRRDVPGGPGAARNAGWPLARAPLVAFTDDDCEPGPGWLAAVLAAARPGAFVQGPTLPAAPPGMFSYTVSRPAPGLWFETTNVAYPRSVLEGLGGFDPAFRRSAEDTDLALRALQHGVELVWAPGAVVRHALLRVGAVGKLRRAWRWDETALLFKRHPRLRRRASLRIFWHVWHTALAGFALAIVLPRRFAALRLLLAAPYVRRMAAPKGLGLAAAPYYVLHDLVEMAAIVRGAIRHRTVLL